MTVAERLRLRLGKLTSAERKVARALTAVRGLEPVAKLAAAAGVSPPTVIRLAAKLEFDGYAEFQRSLKSEVSARLSSPLQIHAERPGARRGGALPDSERLLCDGIRSSFDHLPPAGFERAVQLLADSRRSVTLAGGRFSTMLAEYLATHLRILRPRVQVLSAAGPDRVSGLLDVGRRDVFTAPSPFDALTPAMVLVETIIAAMVDRLGDAPRARMERYDELNNGMVDGSRERPGDEAEVRDDC